MRQLIKAILLLNILNAIALELNEIQFKLKNADNGVALFLNPTNNGLTLKLDKGHVRKMSGNIGIGIDFLENVSSENVSCSEKSCHFLTKDYALDLWNEGDLIMIKWSWGDDTEFQDCFDLVDLDKEQLNWYGGPQIYEQLWPIEKLNLSGEDPYVVRKADNFAVPERYWLNSKGAYLHFADENALYVDQNVNQSGVVCFTNKNTGPYINRESALLSYALTAFDNPRDAHLDAVKKFLGKPTGMPNVKMIREPIWTTWAKYKKNIDDSIVRSFANDILNHGFKGQIEIDEDWETCFGTHVFKPDKFGNISRVVKEIKNNGFRVTLWIHPFVNSECTEVVAEGEKYDYFVKNTTGDMTTVWWESNDARQIDFTNPEAAEWYASKLRPLLENPGVDSFKFDAGETNYVAQPAVYKNVDQELVPNIFTQKYISTVAQFGDLIETRSAYRSQNNSFFLRMIDKDSVWGLDDGLQSLVTTLLQLNMVGYPFVLPDMIGGNAYRQQPTLELIIRWTEATVFMPAMQFSFLPWDYPNDTYSENATEIIKNMVNLHAKYSDKIIEAMNQSIASGAPVNPPIWWIAPEDPEALKNFDEFLLGEDILVAPVMEEGATSRNVYIPDGVWKDGNSETVFQGPAYLVYEAPIDVLPYFIKEQQLN